MVTLTPLMSVTLQTTLWHPPCQRNENENRVTYVGEIFTLCHPRATFWCLLGINLVTTSILNKDVPTSCSLASSVPSLLTTLLESCDTLSIIRDRTSAGQHCVSERLRSKDIREASLRHRGTSNTDVYSFFTKISWCQRMIINRCHEKR